MNRRLLIALVAFVLWTVITVMSGRLIHGGESSLQDTVTSGIGWPWLMAGVFILLVVLWQGWTDVGLNRGADMRGWLLVWLPFLMAAGTLAVAAAIGLPPASMVALVLLNCLFVGFSEELMFRGALLQAFRRTVPIWPAVLLTSAMFGAVHSLNVFVTGELKPALIQSSAAFLSGLAFIALRLRSGSLWPPILLHGFWDFSIFMLGQSAAGSGLGGAGDAAAPAESAWLPALIVLPNAIYGLWLMRDIGRMKANPED